ncbi:alpha/beta hydrolase-fold protein [Balneola sp. MJW-20]|uniref:alpha/beta hydrolase-fold protein n=1 Tax=Gracilimonas aurantiaca TaxID=3234185 RepID=UPI0034662101
MENSTSELDDKIQQISVEIDPVIKKQMTDQLWDSLISVDQVPFRKDSIVYFFYRGEASSVTWNGDFNNWGQRSSGTVTGENIPGTDLWYARDTFPADSRIDYKITLNSNDWILDPSNPHTQYSGFGPNSELRMPEWKEEKLNKLNPEAPKGILSEEQRINSSELGYVVSYKVYTPPGYGNLENLPVLFVTDGHEYADPRLGALTIVLDNLLFNKRIEPLLVVLLSPLAQDKEESNRRVDELGINEDYLSFFSSELIPVINEEYKVSNLAEDRAILGTSLGGLNAAYFIFTKPELLGKAAIQAPAFWFNQEIYSIVRNSKAQDPEIFMSVGTIGDNLNDARQMKKILLEKKYSFDYLEVNEGHSWGAWSSQLDDILIQFYGK